MSSLLQRRMLVVSGLAIVVLLGRLGYEVMFAEPGLLTSAWGQTENHLSDPEIPPPRGTPISDLPCFSCHEVEEFRSGEDFPHELHLEEVGHCHVCHAFEGHMGVVIRSETCEECH